MKRILYAEDEYTNRKLMEIKLEKNGYFCELAEDGGLALELFKKNSYDLVILDLYMPVMNGDVLAEEIRKINSKIPIIAVTSDDEMLEKLKDSVFSEIIIKPLRKQDIIEIIKKYI